MRIPYRQWPPQHYFHTQYQNPPVVACNRQFPIPVVSEYHRVAWAILSDHPAYSTDSFPNPYGSDRPVPYCPNRISYGRTPIRPWSLDLDPPPVPSPPTPHLIEVRMVSIVCADILAMIPSVPPNTSWSLVVSTCHRESEASSNVVWTNGRQIHS